MTFLSTLAAIAALSPAAHTFRAEGDHFLLDGKPFQIRCGEMHYARVPRPYWRDRFRKMKALGLNTVCTYAFWNLHEPERGKYVFTGNADVKEFVKEAQQEGLWVLLRPGPYSCAEWEWGGFPYWLANIPNVQVRSTDPGFLAAATDYLKHLGHELAPMQINHGGPILMVQVENEYGSFGKDLAYKSAIKAALQNAGFDTQLYTADGPSDSMLGGGTLPDVLPAVNFGGDAAGSFKELEKFRPGSPLFCGEFYPGWFDSWGKPHAHTSTEDLVKEIDWMESHHASYSLYMVHGGTTFGFMNGANWYDEGYWPQTTSYDYSTVIDEAGRPTDKYWAVRKVIQAHLGSNDPLPDPPPPLPAISIPRFDMKPGPWLWHILPKKPVEAEHPMSFESLGQAYGFVLYRTTLKQAVRGYVTLEGLQDRAQVFINQIPLETVERGGKPPKFYLDGSVGATLDFLVENMGRINYGPHLLSEHKGLGPVRIDGDEITGWEMFRLPFDQAPSVSDSSEIPNQIAPRLFHGSFSVSELGDTYLDVSSCGKGVLWVNGHNLGRLWQIGPQQTLFMPGAWMKKGKNEVVLWEQEPRGDLDLRIQGRPDPIFGLNIAKAGPG